MSQKKDAIHIIEIGYDEWEVHKISDIEYKYLFYPNTCCGMDQLYRVVIKWDEETGRYDFNAEEYAEIYGSGGWSKWVRFTDEVKTTLFTDASQRIGK